MVQMAFEDVAEEEETVMVNQRRATERGKFVNARGFT